MKRARIYVAFDVETMNDSMELPAMFFPITNACNNAKRDSFGDPRIAKAEVFQAFILPEAKQPEAAPTIAHPVAAQPL